MSKIAENKALETYPEIEGSETYFDRDYICTKPIDLNRQRREGYIKGYEQAMKDFMEKAEKWLEPTFKRIAGYYCGGDLMNDFEKYMEEEL